MVAVWIAVDESGNLGFNFSRRGTTRFLVIAFVFTPDAFSARKRMRRLLRKLTRKGLWLREVPELKFSLSKARAVEMGVEERKAERVAEALREVRTSVLKEIRKLEERGLCAAVSIVDKRQAKAELRNRPDVLYNYVLAHPLITRFIENYNPPPGTRVTVLLDKRLGARAEHALREYVGEKYRYMRDMLRVSYDVSIELRQVNSADEPLIWIADYVAGSVFMLFEHGEYSYCDVIRSLIFDCAYFWAGPRECYRKLGLLM